MVAAVTAVGPVAAAVADMEADPHGRLAVVAAALDGLVRLDWDRPDGRVVADLLDGHQVLRRDGRAVVRACRLVARLVGSPAVAEAVEAVGRREVAATVGGKKNVYAECTYIKAAFSKFIFVNRKHTFMSI